MKFNFFEKKLQIDHEVKSYAEKKVGKLDKFFNHESDASVTFSTERGRCRVEVTLKNNGMFYRASELTNDMYASIDSACALIERQIRKNKTRLSKKLRTEGAVAADDVFEVAEETEFDIVRTKRFAVKPMTAEEAILQMNLLDHNFFVFRNEDTNAISVVYKRKSGGYGLIETEDYA